MKDRLFHKCVTFRMSIFDRQGDNRGFRLNLYILTHDLEQIFVDICDYFEALDPLGLIALFPQKGLAHGLGQYPLWVHS